MKYSILGFNQEKIVAYTKDELKCDLTDLLLLNYVLYAQSNPKMKHIMDENNQPCVWLQHEHILNDLPILNITDGTLKNRLTKLRKMELLTSKTVANEHTQGSRTYYRTTSLLYDMLFETTSLKNDVVEEPRHFKMTSNTQVNNDKEVNNTNSKELVQNFDFGGKQKPKKENLYTKCVSLINDYTTDEKLRKALIDYLRVRLEIKDKPLYTNSWKGLLNKLDRDFDASERLQVVYQSTERGYASFFPVNSYSNNLKEKPWEKGVKSAGYTEEEKRQLDKEREEMMARGERVWY